MRHETAPAWVPAAILLIALCSAGLMIRGGIDVAVWAWRLVRLI